MSKNGILNEGLRKRQEQSVKETEAKIKKALEKQRHAKVINKSLLARETGLSRPTINEYAYLFDGRENESKQTLMLKDQLKEKEIENNRLRKENTDIKSQNKELTDKIIQLYAVLDSLNPKKDRFK